MKKQNIVLTGIMGCGKTTLGLELAKEMHMKFLDLDQYIEDKWGSIKMLFDIGEAHFREIESQAVREISDRKGWVIATGGGVIKRQENIDALKKNGMIFFIDRSPQCILSDIEISERPLLAGGKDKLSVIYRERYPIYLSTCDVHIKNDGSLSAAIEKIKAHLAHDRAGQRIR